MIDPGQGLSFRGLPRGLFLDVPIQKRSWPKQLTGFSFFLGGTDVETHSYKSTETGCDETAGRPPLSCHVLIICVAPAKVSFGTATLLTRKVRPSVTHAQSDCLVWQGQRHPLWNKSAHGRQLLSSLSFLFFFVSPLFLFCLSFSLIPSLPSLSSSLPFPPSLSFLLSPPLSPSLLSSSLLRFSPLLLLSRLSSLLSSLHSTPYNISSPCRKI